MEPGLILETTFLIDLERESSTRTEGACRRFLAAQRSVPLYMTHVVAGELACGVSIAERDRWEQLTAPFYVLPHTQDVNWHYGQAFRYLNRLGTLIAANDLWIAATGLAYAMPVVTRNTAHYLRVPGLEVLGY